MKNATLNKLAIKLFSINNLKDWRIELRNSKRFFGWCLNEEKVIVLAEEFVRDASPSEIKIVLLHEIAHALTPEDCRHGNAWKAKATELGIKPETTPKIQFSFSRRLYADCTKCKLRYQRHRRPSKDIVCCEKVLKWREK